MIETLIGWLIIATMIVWVIVACYREAKSERDEEDLTRSFHSN